MEKDEKSQKIKILAVGDVHGDQGLIKKLAEKAEREKVDLVILAGDLTFLEISTDYIIGPFIKRGKNVLLIPGNHESLATADFMAKKYNVINLHGNSFKKGSLGIFGAGGAMIGPHSTSEYEIYQALKKGHKGILDVKRKIMVTHMHPKGSKSEFSGFEGSKAIRKAIEMFKPDIAINAHIEEAGGIEEKIGKTRVFNVARKERIFEI